jgi:hypothetical protein
MPTNELGIDMLMSRLVPLDLASVSMLRLFDLISPWLLHGHLPPTKTMNKSPCIPPHSASFVEMRPSA